LEAIYINDTGPRPVGRNFSSEFCKKNQVIFWPDGIVCILNLTLEMAKFLTNI